MALTPKQSMFVKEYLIDLNATQAAIRAGYSEKTANEQGCRLLANVSIAESIQEAMDKRAKKVEISSEYVLNTIKETVDRCRQVAPVTDRSGKQVYTETPEGDIVPAFMFQPIGVLKGCELLGKHLKLFTDKSEVEHSGGIHITISQEDAGIL